MRSCAVGIPTGARVALIATYDVSETAIVEVDRALRTVFHGAQPAPGSQGRAS